MLSDKIKLISLYEKESFRLFKKSTKDEKLIYKYEWDNNIIDSIFFEIELLSSEIAGYASNIAKADFRRCEQILASLTTKSIYDNKIIIDWLTAENIEKYSDYYTYIIFLENYRVLVVKACEESYRCL